MTGAKKLFCLFVQCFQTICAIMIMGFMQNIYVKHIEFGTVVQEEIMFKDISYLELCNQ